MTRTGYMDVVRELAAGLNMNYAFGVEFIEVDALDLGVEEPHPPAREGVEEFSRAFRVDRERYRGLHGTAVLSRYPISAAKILRLPVCYDWYGSEKEAIAKIEAARRWSAERVFLERISREVRHGGRMALIADLESPELPGGKVTVVAPHLENKCPPGCRKRQMQALLAAIRDVKSPVILGGDLNTSGSDAAPTSIQREISKRVKDPKFWAGQAVRWFSPVGLPRTILFPANYFRTYADPTKRHIPFLAPNRESGLFRAMERFRFADGGAFDFRGDLERAAAGRRKTLANSNQRAGKGFRPTFKLSRDFGGLVGRFKLDWFFVKPVDLKRPRDKKGSRHFSPHLALTMEELNESVPGNISDHHSLSVDLPLRPH